MKKLIALIGIGLMSFSGQAQTALNFDGVDDCVNMGDVAALNFDQANTFTTEAWIKTPGGGTYMMVVAKQFNGGTYRGYSMFVSNDGKLNFQLINSNGINNRMWVTSTTATLLDDAWHHIAVTYDGTSLASGVVMYIDGVASPNIIIADNLTATVVSTANFKIGDRSTTALPFTGNIDDVRVWNTTRTPAEILANMSACLTGAELNLLALYDFEDGAPSATLTDLTINGFDGSLLPLMDPINDWVAGLACPVPCSITDQTITQTDFTAICSADTIATIGSEFGVDYYLRDDSDDSVIDGPIAGTGANINLSTGSVGATTTYNVFAEVPGSSNALDFDGANDFIQIPHNASLNVSGGGEVTMEAWIFPNVGGAWENIIMKGNYGYGLALQSSNQIYFWDTGCGGCNVAPSDVAATPGVWNHVAVTVLDLGATMTVTYYLNGVNVGVKTSPIAQINDNVGDLYIGRQGAGCACNYMNGMVDDVRIWNDVRTQVEIAAEMNNCLDGTEANLVGYWKLDEGTGSATVSDETGNALDGTLMLMNPAVDWGVGNITCTGCQLEMTDMLTITINPIGDQTLLEADWASCGTQSDSLLTLNNSETGVDYYLRDDADNSIIDGPITGSGGPINFNTGAIASTTTFNVNSEAVSSSQTGDGLNFDALNDFVLAGNPATLQLSQGTYEAWIRTTNAGNSYRGIMGKALATHLFLMNN
ncbi:MAG: hypothetical protein ACI857_001761, partial [Arenicella sp.]